MSQTDVLDLPAHVRPDPDELVRAAMEWHFDPGTGSPFWLREAADLPFDPRSDVKSWGDLKLFPNLAAKLRDVPARSLIPAGYGPDPGLVGLFESGGTTGAPKRVPLLRDWLDRLLHYSERNLDAHGFPRGVDWAGVTPTGPHIVGEFFRRSAVARGGIGLTVDLDPRWVKQLIATGRAEDAGAYAEHVVDQLAHVLRTQDVGVLVITPPLLERLTRRDELVELVNSKIRAIRWGGTQLDPDSRYLYRTEVFPEVAMCGNYGSTMVAGFAGERPGLGDDDPCVFDPPGPHVGFRVVDPVTGQDVAYGERGQVVANHVSRSFLLPNNLERDLATRVRPPADGAGDSVADLGPVARFEDEDVVEGVY